MDTQNSKTTADLATQSRRSVLAGGFALFIKQVLFTGAVVSLKDLAGCGGGGSAPPSSGSQNAASASITSVNSTTPSALSMLSINTTGFDASKPVSVSVTATPGSTYQLTPVRFQSDGTVVVALPLYVDPATAMTSGYSAAVVVSQGSLSTNSTTVSVQDIPPLSTYGAGLGAISHAFYDFLAITQGRVVNELAAIQAMFTGVDTSSVRAALSAQMLNAIHARNDVDRVIVDSSTQIPAGTLSSGLPFYFNAKSVEIMDRLFGYYLNALQGAVGSAKYQHRSRNHDYQVRTQLAASNLNVLSTVLGGTISETLGIVGAISNAAAPGSTTTTQVLDGISGVLIGATKYLAVAGLVTGGTADVAAVVTGVLGGTVALISDGIKAYNAQQQVIQLSQSGASQTALTNAIDARNAAYVSIVTDELGAALSLLGGSAIVQENLLANATFQGATLAASIAGLSADTIGQWITTSTNAGNQVSQVFSTPQQGFGNVTGGATINNTNGNSALSGLYETDIGVGSGSASETFSGITDSSGSYDVLIPLSVPGLDYSTSSITIVDPSTKAALGTEPVNLSNVTATQPLSEPPLVGNCTDTDASTPDGDDPDCD